MDMAQVDQEEFPIDDDEDIETVELPADSEEGTLDDDPEAGTAEDTADHKTLDSEQETN